MHKYKRGDIVKYQMGYETISIEKIISKATQFNEPHYKAKTLLNYNTNGVQIGEVGIIEESNIIDWAIDWMKTNEFNNDLKDLIEENVNENK